MENIVYTLEAVKKYIHEKIFTRHDNRNVREILGRNCIKIIDVKGLPLTLKQALKVIVNF